MYLISCVGVIRDEAELFNAWRIDFLILPVKFEENKKVNLHLRRDLQYKLERRNLRGNKHASDAEELKSLSFQVVSMEEPVDEIHCEVKSVRHKCVFLRDL